MQRLYIYRLVRYAFHVSGETAVTIGDGGIMETIGNLFSIFHGLSMFFILALMLFTFAMIALVVRFFGTDIDEAR